MSEVVEKKWQKVYEPYAAALGQALISWNRLHDTLGKLFGAILRVRCRPLPMAVWHSSDSDRIMRDALLAAATAKFGVKQKTLLADIEWVVGEVDSLASDRNAATHALLIIESHGVEPDASHPKAAKLKNKLKAKGKSLISEFAAYEARATQLSAFAFVLGAHIHKPSQLPWPEKPGLPHFLPKTSQAEQHRKKVEKSRLRQQQALRAKSRGKRPEGAQ